MTSEQLFKIFVNMIPNERDRFLKLIVESENNNPILLESILYSHLVYDIMEDVEFQSQCLKHDNFTQFIVSVVEEGELEAFKTIQVKGQDDDCT